MKDKLTADRARPAQACPSPLVPLKQIPCRNLVLNACEFVAPAVGHDNVVVGLEDLRVMHHLAPEELQRVRRGFVDHHGHVLTFIRFMTPRMEIARKLADPSSGVR